MTQPLRGIYGAGGHGRETLSVARSDQSCDYVFIDDAPRESVLNGHRVLTYAEFLADPRADKRINLAIGDSRIRERLAARCTADGLPFFSVIAPNAVIGDTVELGEGCIVSPFSLITANVRIGHHVHINMHSYIAHDSQVDDFATFGPAVCCNGNVHVGRHAYLGAGALIRHGLPGAPTTIGASAIVGMGAVVLQSVPPDVTVAGNPARPLSHRR